MTKHSAVPKDVQKCIFNFLEVNHQYTTFLDYCNEHLDLLGQASSQQRGTSQRFKSKWVVVKANEPEKYQAKLESVFGEDSSSTQAMSNATRGKSHKQKLSFADLSKQDDDKLLAAMNDLGLGKDDDEDYGAFFLCFYCSHPFCYFHEI
jgi:hypothetical protein